MQLLPCLCKVPLAQLLSLDMAWTDVEGQRNRAPSQFERKPEIERTMVIRERMKGRRRETSRRVGMKEVPSRQSGLWWSPPISSNPGGPYSLRRYYASSEFDAFQKAAY